MPVLSDAVKAEVLDSAVRVYAVRPHPAQPHLFALVTSVGLVMVSIGRAQVRGFACYVLFICILRLQCFLTAQQNMWKLD